MRLSVTIHDICCDDMRKALAEGVYSAILSAPRGVPMAIFDNRMGRDIICCPWCVCKIKCNQEVQMGFGGVRKCAKVSKEA